MVNKLVLCIIVLCLFLTGCGSGKKQVNDVHMETVEIKRSGLDVDPDTTKAYEVEIKYHVVVDALPAVKDSINWRIRMFLSNWFTIPDKGDFNLGELVSENLREFYGKVDRENLQDCFTCRVKEIKIQAGDCYQNKHIISVPYTWYTYEGGAHGNYGTICYVFDKKTGNLISYKELVKNEPKLLEVAEKVFREQMGIKDDEATPDMFSFENNRFALNDNFGLTADTLTFYYNPYEIAPYAAGLIELKLPIEQVKGFINFVD